MGQGLLGNIRLHQGPPIPEPAADLQIDSEYDTECQVPTYLEGARIWSGSIDTGDAGNLRSCLGKVEEKKMREWSG